MANDLTIDQFKKVVPKTLVSTIDQSLVDNLNKTMGNAEEKERFRDNLMSYAHILKEGRYKVSSYISAVKFVSLKHLGNNNEGAFIKTFPDRYQELLNAKVSSSQIQSYAANYCRTKLVTILLEQTLTPFYIVNADMYQKALNVQVTLMTTANSEKVRSDAANSILTHLKPPETRKIELDIGIKEDKSIVELRNTTLELVAQQRLALKAGINSVQEVAHSKLLIANDEDIIEGEIVP